MNLNRQQFAACDAVEVTPMWAGELDASHVDAMFAGKIPDELMPSRPSRATAMYRAVYTLAPRGAKVDKLPKGLGVSMSLKDVRNLDLAELAAHSGGVVVREAASYRATLTAKILCQNVNGTEIETVSFTPEDHPMVPLLREMYQIKKEQYSCSEDLSVWFSQTIIPACGGVGKRSRGGVYYVPSSKKDLLLGVAEALESISDSNALVRNVNGVQVPVHRLTRGGKLCLEARYASDAAAMEILIDGVIREADSALDDVAGALDASASGDKPLGKRALATKKESLAALEQTISTWEGMTSVSLDLLRNRLEEMRAVIGTAELAAELASL